MPNTTEVIKRLTVNNAEIEWSDRGQGDPILLIHAGVFADWFLPMAASQQLDGFRVIRVRRAGYGTNAPPRPLTLQDHATHIQMLAEFLGMETIHLVGHSSGGLIALQLANDHPGLVHSLTLLEPAPCGPLQVPAFAEIGAHFVGPAMAAFAEGDIEKAFASFMRGVCGDRYRDVIVQSLGKAGYARAVAESSFFFRDEIPASLQWTFGVSEFTCIQQPVLVVEGAQGRNEGLLSRQVTEMAMTLLPKAELALVEGVNHLMPLQDPDAVARVIAGFCHRHPISSSQATEAMA